MTGIKKWLDGSLQVLDRATQSGSRRLARRTSRRSFISRLGGWATGAALLPLLPVARALASAGNADSVLDDDQSCEYWRYCALHGTLCSCCGGSYSQCPPGSEVSPISWVGTCHNPDDGRDYLISYNDCCGKPICERCYCHNTERERPVYMTAKSAAVLWCFGTESRAYHCTVAAVLGEAGQDG